MSRSIDEKVVEMRFDNKDFESNVQTSMSTLDKLKAALDFTGASRGLDGISSAAAGVNLSGIGQAVDEVKEKFSAFEIAAVTALVNITNKAVDAGIQMAKSLTVDQVAAGWDKYAEKTTAVQTIMAATKKEFSDEAVQMEYVNEQLDKLNWFTDETSYNLVDMVSNIGKFTNAGISLDSAVTSMQGVATWAAISGANAQEASRAMYNLAQATGTGYMQMIDWKSIENANMATMEFKEMAIQAGLALGTLEEVDGQIQTVDTGLAKKYSTQVVTAQNFASTLTSGAWLTNDVLNKVLDQYGGFTNALNEAYNETGLETIKILKYIEDYEKGLLDLDKVSRDTGVDADRLRVIFSNLADPTYELGRRAFKAAQETKTFAEVIAYTKDAVSSGWMNTFEIIFGDYEEAKAMWSDLSEVFYDIFVASGDARNEMLEAWKELGGRTSMLDTISNAYGAIVKVVDTVKEAFHDIFPAKDSEEKGKALFDFTERIREFTEKLILSDEAAEKLKDFIRPLFELLKRFTDIIRGAGKEAAETLIPALKQLIDPIKKIIEPLGRVVSTFKDFIKFAIEPLLKVPRDIWNGFTSGLPGVISGFEDIADKVSIWLTNFNETLLTSEKVQTALQGIRKVVKDISGFLGNFFSLSQTIESYQRSGGGIAGVIGVIADKLSQVWDLITNIIKDITGINISEGIIGKIAETIGGALDRIREAFANFKKTDTSGVDKVREDTEKKLGPIAALFEGLKGLLSGVWEFLKKIGTLISPLVSAIGSALGSFGQSISNAVSNMDASNVIDLANGGVLVAIGVGIKKLIDIISGFLDKANESVSIFDKLKNAISPITGVLDSARGALEAWQQNLKADMLLKLAAAIGIITIAVIALSEIDIDKLSTALSAITIEFGDLMGTMAVFSKFTAGLDAKGMRTAGLVMIELSAAVLILSSAIKKLAELDQEQITQGLMAIIALSADLVIAAKQIGNNAKGMTSGAIGMIAFAAAIKILASAVTDLSKLKWGDMIEGLAGVGALCLELSLFLKSTDLDGMSMSKGLGFLTFAASLKVLASAIGDIAELSWGEMIQGLVGMGAVLAEIVAFEKFAGSGGNLIATATGMILLGAAMKIMSGVLESFGSMQLDEIGRGLLAMAGALAEIVIAINLLPKDTIVTAAGLIALGAALEILSDVMIKFGGMEWEEIGKSLVMLAGTFGILLVAGLALGPLTPVIVALSAAVALLGVGCMGIAAALTGFAVALTALSAAGAAGIELLVLAIKSIISLIPFLIESVAEGLVAFIKMIGDSFGEIAQALIQIGHGLLETLRELIPDLVVTVVEIIDEVLKTLVEHGPSILESVFEIFSMLLAGLTEKLPEITELVVNFLLTLIQSITERIPDFVQAAFDIVIALIDGLGQALVDNAPRLREALLNLCKNILKAILGFFGIHSPSKVFEDIGEKLILGLIEGIVGMVTGAVKAITDLASDLVKGIKEKLEEFKQKGKELVEKIKTGISDKAKAVKEKMTEVVEGVKGKISEKVEDFKEKGKELLEKIRGGMTDEQRETFDKMVETVTGLKDKIGEKLSWFTDKGGEIMDALKSGTSAKDKLDALTGVMEGIIGDVKESIKKKIEDFVSIGGDILGGLKKGIEDGWNSFTKTIGEKFSGWVDGIKDFFGIGSPSKLFAEMGGFIDEGLALGIDKNIRIVTSASEKLGDRTVDGMNEALNRIGDTLGSDLDAEPVIAPVVDLSGVDRGMRSIDRMFAARKTYDLAADASFTINGRSEKNQNELKIDNREVTDSIKSLQDEVKSLKSTIKDMKLVLDSGAVVGGITDRLDRALGQRSILAGRGV